MHAHLPPVPLFVLQGCKQWLILSILNKHVAFEVRDVREMAHYGSIRRVA